MALSVEIRHIRSIVSGLEVGGAMPQEASEYGEKSLVANLAKRIPEGSLVSLQLHIGLPSGDSACEVTAKVVSCEETAGENGGEALFRVHFHLNQYNQSFWLSFLKAANEDQQRVEKLFRAMKGELE